MATYARQSEVLKISEQEALEGYWYLIRNRPGLADRYEDYKQVRIEARDTAAQLALIEKAFGTRKLRQWLSDMSSDATKELNGKNAA